MKKGIWSVLLALALVASAFSSAAQADPPEVPADPNIVDDSGDALFGGSTVADILAAWFTEDGDKITFHVQTVAAPPPSANGVEYRISASPDAEDNDCLVVRGLVPNGAFVGEPAAKMFDACNSSSGWFTEGAAEGEIEFGELPDETAYISMTFDKAASPYTTDGATIGTPRADSYVVVGHQEQGFQPVAADDTERGRDHEVGASSEPPGKTGGTPVKKGCKKNPDKGKKKGCPKGKGKTNAPGQKKKKPKKCAPYEPGELGAEVEEETTIVTDAATEEAPIEVPVETAEGLGFTSTDPGGDTGPTSHVYQNLQVDPKAKTTGLYVRVEYSPAFDYDIFLRLADGTAVAYEADFNPAPGTGLGGLEGAHAEQGAGQIDGYEANDCDGFTMDIASAITPGGEVTMKLWLGEPGGSEEDGARAALTMLQETFKA
jgi:hypothetical protein